MPDNTPSADGALAECCAGRKGRKTQGSWEQLNPGPSGVEVETLVLCLSPLPPAPPGT